MSLPTEPMAKRLKPHPDMDQGQDQAPVHCPRCDSANTKFCYYNNYSLSQPRYFCKSCRRYWTKGGTLRNIPMGGVSRKNKRLSSVSVSAAHRRSCSELQPQQRLHYDKLAFLSDGTAISRSSIALQHSYPTSPVLPFFKNPDRFMFENLTIDFMESGSDSRDYNGGDYLPFMTRGFGAGTGNIHGPSPVTETMSYFDDHYEKMINGDDVKPKVFDSGCHSDLHGSGIGRNGSPWAGLINGYGSSSTNPLV